MTDPPEDPSQLAASPGGQADAELFLVACGYSGPKLVSLELQSVVMIGRDQRCDLSLPDPPLSRRHARFSRRGDRVLVEDLDSRHGVWIADRRVQQAELAVGDSVRLANVVVAVALLPRIPVTDTDHSHVPEARYLSPAMRETREVLHRVALTDLPVLLVGETGTGKELAAQEVHLGSQRRKQPLRVLHCAAISPELIESTLSGHEPGAVPGTDGARRGVFEDAHGGTVFLDEVGELSPAAQGALLQVLDTRRITRLGAHHELAVDVRVIAATHRDLYALAVEGDFRIDLLHHLSVITVQLPPLRKRRDELPALARHLLSQMRGPHELDPTVLVRFEEYDWPGNIRELRNVLARCAAVAEGPRITEADLPESLRGEDPALAEPHLRTADTLPDDGTLCGQLRLLERERMLRALQQTAGNQRRAAALLGVPLRTLERRLRELRQSAH